MYGVNSMEGKNERKNKVTRKVRIPGVVFLLKHMKSGFRGMSISSSKGKIMKQTRDYCTRKQFFCFSVLQNSTIREQPHPPPPNQEKLDMFQLNLNFKKKQMTMESYFNKI